MESETESIKKDFLITQYKHLAEEVRFSKRQQMMGTWYVLFFYAAIVNTHKSWPTFESPDTHWTAIIVSIFPLLIGLLFIRSCQKSQHNNNRMVKKVRKEFPLPKNMTEGEVVCSINISCLYYLIHILAFAISVLIILN